MTEIKTIDVDITESDLGKIEGQEENEKKILVGSRLKDKIILFSIFLTVFFTQYPHVGLSPSIAKIANDLHDSTNMSWYMTGFTLASVIFQLLGVRISDCLGRQRTVLYSFSLFICISLLCGFSINGAMFIACRVIQGMATGVVQTTVFASMIDLFSIEDRLEYLPQVSTAFSFALIVSPVLCGVLVDRSSWGWIFWIIPICCFPILVSFYFFLQIPIKPDQTLSKENLKTLTRRIDPIGCILISIGIGFFLMGMHLASASIGYSWSSPLVVGFLCGSVGIFVLFLIFEKFITPIPLFPSAVVLNKDLIICYYQQFINGWQFPFFDLVLFIEYQVVFDATTTEAAYRIIPGAIANLMASFIGSKICYRIGSPKPIAVTGLLMMIFGQILLLFVQKLNSNMAVQIVIVIIYQIGIGCSAQFSTLSSQMILQQRHEHLVPLSLSLCRCLVFCGITCSISFSLSLLQSRLSIEMNQLLQTQPSIYEIIRNSGAEINYTKVHEITSEIAKKTIQNIYHRNIRYIIYSNLILTSICLIGAFFGKVPSLKKKNTEKEDIEKIDT